MTSSIPIGSVLPGYPYLSRWQSDRGETEGRKHRPACVAVSMRGSDGLTHLALLAITGSPPYADQTAVKLPALEIRRIGLDPGKDAWIIVSEYNYDILERSFSLEPPRAPLPTLSPAVLRIVLNAFRSFLAEPLARVERV